MASRRTRVTVSADRGGFMIAAAAERAEMHPQTLRIYDARGLIEPRRSPKGTRPHSQKDVELLRRIQEMTNELGLNLAGVERVLELEAKLQRAQAKVEALERRAAELKQEVARLAEKRDQLRAEIVPYEQCGTDLVRAKDLQAIKLRVQRRA